ncbi:uncharacterized protein LALA0_S06e07118g [Lachancea lanzarotensis]|uniref:LALA0S06e07118g1_1 n=1 Tax=Lachancea lanzarotensis TaxID=1245769 RepID=A0A0C7N4P7_9SACH|nr:uncharacterized protein LALA0_S06e07118g [Lachancea lanzarotensis]CEP62927.1 LALA0S06e07118g1_1 [Lachancea lanzarotensis]
MQQNQSSLFKSFRTMMNSIEQSEQEEIALENDKIKFSQMASVLTTHLQYHEKFGSTNLGLAKFIGDQCHAF